jgi:transcriptional regulator with XRE-family HTH domain
MLSWSIRRLEAASGISAGTISHFEIGDRIPTRGNLRHLIIALTDAGIVFVPHGVTLPAPPNQQD